MNVDKDGNVCLAALVNCVKSHMCSELTRGRSMCKQAEPDLRGRPCFECRDDPAGDDGDGNGEGGDSQALIPAGSGDSDRTRGGIGRRITNQAKVISQLLSSRREGR